MRKKFFFLYGKLAGVKISRLGNLGFLGGGGGSEKVSVYAITFKRKRNENL